MNRRSFLKVGGAGVAALAGAEFAAPLLRALASPDLPPPLRAPAAVETRDPIHRLLNRIGFGPTPGQIEQVRKIGVQAYIERQLRAEKILDAPSEGRLFNYVTLDKTGPELIALTKKPDEIRQELVGATVLRATYSEAHLGEVMINFWTDHFNIYHRKDLCAVLKTIDDREVIRKYYLGRFRDLLGASAHSAAMLFYLDNSKSHRANANENYAREIMELHTLGVGNYTEDDVKAVARAFTGWTFVDRLTSPTFGSFAYAPGLHDDTEKVILGQIFPAGRGIDEGERVLDILAAHPATAKRLAFKLCRRFIADEPPDSAVEAAAKTYSETGGDIREVVRTIINSPEFASAPPKFKRSFEYLISLFRALGVEFSSPVRSNVINALVRMEHLPFNWPQPNGYSDIGRDWIGNMMARWTVALQTAQGSLPGTPLDLVATAAQQGAQTDLRSIIGYYVSHLLGQTLSESEMETIYKFATREGEPALDSADGKRLLGEMVALIAASPAFQYR